MLLSVKSLRKSYSGFSLRALSFQIEGGEILALLGKNGSGKSTLIKSVLGLVSPDELIFDYYGDSFKKEVAAILEGEVGLYPGLTVIENGSYFSRLFNGSFDELYFGRLARMLKLEPYLSQKVETLSTGNKRKAALACIFCRRPRLVFLDEPTLGLDFQSKRNIAQFIREMAQSAGLAVILTSHDLVFIEELAHRALVLDDGRVVFSGLLSSYLDRGKGIEGRLLMKEPIPQLLAEFGQEVSGEGLQVNFPSYVELARFSTLLSKYEDAVTSFRLTAGQQRLEEKLSV